MMYVAESMEYGLSDEFCRRHFLVGVLLREVCKQYHASSASYHPPPPCNMLLWFCVGGVCFGVRGWSGQSQDPQGVEKPAGQARLRHSLR